APALPFDVPFEQADVRIRTFEALARLAEVGGAAGQEPRRARVVEAPDPAEIPGVGVGRSLPPFAQPLNGEALRLEPVDDVGPVREGPGFAEQAEPGLVPGRGQDPRLDRRPLDAEEGRRLVELIQKTDRQEEMAGAQVEFGLEQEIEIGELDRDLLAAVLELDLGVEQEAVVPLVADVDDRALEDRHGVLSGGLAVIRLAVRPFIEGLAVAADRDAALSAVDLGGRGAHAIRAAVGRDRGLADLELLDLRREDVDLALDLGQLAGGGRGRGLRSGGSCRAELRHFGLQGGHLPLELPDPLALGLRSGGSPGAEEKGEGERRDGRDEDATAAAAVAERALGVENRMHHVKSPPVRSETSGRVVKEGGGFSRAPPTGPPPSGFVFLPLRKPPRAGRPALRKASISWHPGARSRASRRPARAS